MPLREEVAFFIVWFDPDLPVLRIHLNNTGPTARLTARCYRAQILFNFFAIILLRCGFQNVTHLHNPVVVSISRLGEIKQFSKSRHTHKRNLNHSKKITAVSCFLVSEKALNVLISGANLCSESN